MGNPDCQQTIIHDSGNFHGHTQTSQIHLDTPTSQIHSMGKNMQFVHGTHWQVIASSVSKQLRDPTSPSWTWHWCKQDRVNVLVNRYWPVGIVFPFVDWQWDLTTTQIFTPKFHPKTPWPCNGLSLNYNMLQPNYSLPWPANFAAPFGSLMLANSRGVATIIPWKCSWRCGKKWQHQGWERAVRIIEFLDLKFLKV